MSEVYRGHEIVVLDCTPKCAVIVERLTGTPLPTKITALPDEAESAYLQRARHLVDLYLERLPTPLTGSRRQEVSGQSRTL